MNAMEEDDFQLLGQWCGGDKGAGQRLLARHFDSLSRFFESKCPRDADDLVQRTLLACVAAKNSLRREASFRTWLFTVARNTLYAHLRSAGTLGAQVDFSISSIAELVTTPGTRLARSAEHRRVVEALRALSVEQQTLLELHYWEGLDVAALSEVFALEPGTTRVRLHRARQRLREVLELGGEADAVAMGRARA